MGVRCVGANGQPCIAERSGNPFEIDGVKYNIPLCRVCKSNFEKCISKVTDGQLLTPLKLQQPSSLKRTEAEQNTTVTTDTPESQVNNTHDALPKADAANEKKTSPKADVNNSNTSSNNNTSPDNAMNKDDTDDQTPDDVTSPALVIPIIDPILAYVKWCTLSACYEQIKAAITGEFVLEQIVTAKERLWAWALLDPDILKIIGPKSRRRGTLTRTEEDAHTSDIISAIQKLDKASTMPIVYVEAEYIAIIPRCSPEELDQISVVERLSALEHKVNRQQRYMSEMKIQIEDIRTAAEEEHNDTEDNDDNDSMTTEDFQYLARKLIDEQAEGDANIGEAIAAALNRDNTKIHTPDVTITKVTRDPGLNKNTMQPPNQNRNAKTDVHETGSSTKSKPESCLKNTERVKSSKSVKFDRNKPVQSDNYCTSSESDDSEGSIDSFSEISPHEKRKKQKREKHRQNMLSKNVMDKSTNGWRSHLNQQDTTNKDIWIRGVPKEVTTNEIRADLHDNGFNAVFLARVSHDDAPVKSYRLRVPLDEYKFLMDPSTNFWPKCIEVREFKPRSRHGNRRETYHKRAPWTR